MAQMLTLDDILMNACHNPADGEDGYSTYRIETHCTAFIITAKLIGYTADPIRAGGRKPEYLIRSYKTEDC